MTPKIRQRWRLLSSDWPTLTIYQRFESGVALALTVLITLVIIVALFQQTIIQTKVVLLIAVLALARKFIVLDPDKTSPQTLYGLAAVLVALGITYWFTRDREERIAPPPA